MASNDSRFFQCDVAVWRVCVPHTQRHWTVTVSGTCVVCEVLKEGVAPVSPFHFLARAQHVAIRGYPFNALSEKSLAPFEHSAVLSLALIDANITDVEKNIFSGFFSLRTLSLDSNRLASVKQAWFAGLKRLTRLILSNNNIRQIEPRSFVHLDLLFFLDLESNLLHDVDPAWFNGMRYRMLHMNLSLNPIHTISRGSFQLTKLRSLDLSGTDLSCLDEDVFRGQSWLNRLHVGSRNATFEGVGMSFVQTQDTNTFTTTAHTNGNNAKNITCILVNKVEHRELVFTTIHDQPQTHTTSPAYTTDTDHSINLTHYSEYTDEHQTSTKQRDNTTLQDGTTTCAPVHVSEQIEVPPATDHVLISVVVSVVVGLAVSSLVVLVWKMYLARTTEDDRPTDSAQVWTIPRGIAFPGLLRSASLPAGSSRTASHGVVSCKSWPTLLLSMELSSDRTIARRPLPRLPHVYWEIPDDAISVSGVVRSASLPALSTSGVAQDDAASCRSLPAVLSSIEPTYSEIPDHMAAAQRPLPALPRACWELPAAQGPLPLPEHTYSEIPDDKEREPVPFYDDTAWFLPHAVANRGRVFQDVKTSTSSTYGSDVESKAQCKYVYTKAPEVQGVRACRKWPLEIPGNGSRMTPRRVSLFFPSLTNTY
ncbi:PREDICTED: uncharacterized protein LOC109485999 [Branchiostoma belcheri]|uniref:Uncharacterized protein LOC109485999 n=1 Tax=Branchiostoma belcheri TaxID=7741 RepID=A0A6P5AFX0_BRABE|nr:PREDICTED: uncharacterized protein LOC109485999 [Branchiostoma belcheri]